MIVVACIAPDVFSRSIVVRLAQSFVV